MCPLKFYFKVVYTIFYHGKFYRLDLDCLRLNLKVFLTVLCAILKSVYSVVITQLFLGRESEISGKGGGSFAPNSPRINTANNIYYLIVLLCIFVLSCMFFSFVYI